MRTVARLVTRMQGTDDGLIVGTALKGQTFFEPNTVYEVVDVLGQLTVRKLGKSCGLDEGETTKDSSESHLWFGKLFSWASSIAEILEARKGCLFLTREEYAAYLKSRKS